MFDTILIPTDGSDHAGRAAEHGRYLAQLFDATVHLLAVVDIQGRAGVFDAGGVDEQFVSGLEDAAATAIEQLEKQFEAPDSVRTAIREGSPTDVILDYADDHDVDLLAMGTHGRTGLNRYILGSVTERVVRRADVPVLTVRATDRSRKADYDEILVPTDGSEAATSAVAPGVEIARQAGARVHAVNVVNVGELAQAPDVTLPTEVFEQLQSQGKKATEAIAAQAQEAGLDAVTDVREGFPANELLDYAETNEVDLIAMGTAGRTGPSRYLLGSTTERVIRHAEVPVLAVNARDQSAEE